MAKKSDVTIELVRGQFGHTGLYINNFRIAGDKPWGGGRAIWHANVSRADLQRALAESGVLPKRQRKKKRKRRSHA